MLCREFEERISDYCDGLLAESERTAFQSHAAECAHCRLLLGEIEDVIRISHNFPLLAVPVHLEERILAATIGKRRGFSWENLLQGDLSFLYRVPRFAMGLALVICFVAFTAWRFESRTEEQGSATQVVLSQLDSFTQGIYTQGLRLYYAKNRIVSELDYLKTGLTSQIEYSWNRITGGKKKEPAKSDKPPVPQANPPGKEEEKQRSEKRTDVFTV